MSRDVIRQLKALKHADINPSEEWLDNNRALLMSQIKNTIRPLKKSFITSFMHRAEEVFLHSSHRLIRVGVAVVLVAVVAVTGRVATSQAAGAIPGDTLYGLKRTTENTKLAIASVVADQNQLVKLHLDLAAVRADEVKQVVTRRPERKEAAQAAVKDLQQELQTANQKLDTLKQQAPNNVKDTVMNAQQTTNAIKDTLQDVKDNLQTSTSSADKNLSQDLATAKQLVNDTNVATVQVAVANHLQGGDVSKDDVTKVVDNTLQSVVADTTQSKQALADVNNAVNQLSTSTLATSTIATTTIKLVSTETAQATEQTKVAGQQIDQKVSEVKALVAQGDDLTHVVDKVREVSDASTAVEKISDKTIQNVQTLLPQVQVFKSNDSSTSTSSTPTTSTTTGASTTTFRSTPTTTVSTSTTSTIRNTSSTPTSTFTTTTFRTTTSVTSTTTTTTSSTIKPVN